MAMQTAYRFPVAEVLIYRSAAPFRNSAWQDIAMHSANLDRRSGTLRKLHE